MRCALRIALAAGAMLAMPSAGHAQFRVCNRTAADEIYVAFALLSGQSGWESEGWYTITRDTCSTLVQGELHNRYYYVYAESKDTIWDGESDDGGASFCVRDGDAFKLDDIKLEDTRDDLQCGKRGYSAKKFMQVDTEGAASYSFDLED